MDRRNFAELCLTRAQEKYDEAEVFVQASNSSAIKFYNGNLEEFSLADTNGAQLLVRSGNKWANAYTEQIEEETIDFLLDKVEASLDVAEENADQSLYVPEAGETLADLPKRGHFDFDSEKIISYLQNLSNKAGELSKEIKVTMTSVGFQSGHKILLNSQGLDKEEKGSAAYVMIYVVLDRDGEMKSDMAFRFIENLEEVDPAELAGEAIEKASSAYGAKSMKAGTYPIVIENRTFSSLFSAALSAGFSSEMVQKGMSLLADKKGEQIAAEVLNVYDDPASEHALVPSNFDDEGVPRQNLPLIEKGVLKNFFYNLETAKKDNLESTGNASRSYKSKSTPGPGFIRFVPGEKDFSELLQEVGSGLLITSLQGLHSGLDPISGDFSLPANGFLIEDGKKGRPVNQITIAGNILDLLKNIRQLGSDAVLTMDNSYVPSVIVDNVAVSGEE